MHGDADLFVVLVDGGPVGGLAAEAGAADAGEDGGDDMLAEGEQGGDGAGGVGGDVVAAGAAGLVEQLLAADLAEVVGGLAGCVVGVGLAGDGTRLGGELADWSSP